MLDSNFLRENNARHSWQPMGHPGECRDNPPPVIVEAEGNRIRDLDGRQTLDAVGGLWNVNLGFSCEPVKRAISDQLARLPYYSTFRGTTNDKVIELGYALREFFAEEDMGRAFFTSGGSDSVETALRLARQYHRIRGETGRYKFISLRNAYHGTHFGGSSVNGGYRFRESYEPLLPGCFHIPAPYCYRNPFDESDPEKLAAKCAAALISEIEFQKPSTIAAFIMEPVLGAGGVIPPHRSFMPAVREICSAHGILLIADEVITGFGRTGSWSGSRHWGVKPDIMTIAKAITCGYFPFGAAMISESMAEIFESDKTEAGFIGHGYTYSGHPVGAAAGIACLEETVRLNVKDNAAARGDQLFAGIKALKEKYPVVGDVRGGHGLMLALELVSDRTAKTPADKATVERIHARVYEAGVMVRLSGHNLFLSPPLVITEAEADEILAALDAGLAVA
ncbi:MAG: aminotransferase class III-fold pyridoxal phosphate-dependent enzyme [Rhodobacteraceae bacterium]|nr:aminotransferase class III-fold pyridoxal phosphate-dependent enzyme [Paracoccaceae bacterium]